ncbi:unnamed protein product [Caenorhabditis sp. 36 PRJEB53466]|nr:unnamed protein product [Caenorhabditis sp. 36 PRJEB53466]
MEIKKVNLTDYKEQIYQIRQKVFIEEQGCPEHTEWSEEEEENSVYFLCLEDSKAVACIRIRKMGKGLLKLERVAVLKEWRQRGIASELVRQAIREFQSTAPNCSLYAFAQGMAGRKKRADAPYNLLVDAPIPGSVPQQCESIKLCKLCKMGYSSSERYSKDPKSLSSENYSNKEDNT